MLQKSFSNGWPSLQVRETRCCFECDKKGHIARNFHQCKNKNDKGKDQEGLAELASHAMILMENAEERDEAFVRFLIDSGASDHMMNEQCWTRTMDTTSNNKKKVVVGNG